MTAFMDWKGRDESAAALELANRYWPPDMDQQDAIALTLMTTGLSARLAEQGSSGALPDLDALRLTEAEREQLLREELDRIATDWTSRGVRFLVEEVTAGSATYRLRSGLFGRKSQPFHLTISDFGLAAVKAVGAGSH